MTGWIWFDRSSSSLHVGLQENPVNSSIASVHHVRPSFVTQKIDARVFSCAM